MGIKQLIILYGPISSNSDPKYQAMINDSVNCGYREYAKRFGYIIYLRPQEVHQDFEKSMPDTKEVVRFCNTHPDHLVWSVKWDNEKDQLLSRINNKKVYYSCNNKNMYSNNVQKNLVDTLERMRSDTLLWFKGKDPLFWKPLNPNRDDIVYDYVMIGRRADKNELFFLSQLEDVKETRRVLWIGGREHKDSPIVKQSHHKIYTTPLISRSEVRDYLQECKIGILYTEHPTEGFPQSFIEMAMCGVNVIYPSKAPRNHFYDSIMYTRCKHKGELLDVAEEKLLSWSLMHSNNISDTACDKLDIDKSYERICEHV